MPSDGEHGFGNRVANPDRPPCLARQGDHQRLEFCIRLAAEAAAQERDNYSYLGGVQAKDLGEIASNLKRMLGRGPDRNPLIVEIRDDRVGLHGIVVDHGKGEGIFKDLIGLGKALFDIALFHMLVAADVIAQILMDQRRPFAQSGIQTNGRGQLLVTDRYQGEGLLCSLLILSRDRSHRLSCITDLFDSDDRSPAIIGIDVGNIGRGEHRGHAGERLGRRGIDTYDARVGIRAAQYSAVEHPGNLEIPGEFCLPRYLLNPVYPENILADELKLFLWHPDIRKKRRLGKNTLRDLYLSW